MAEPTPLVLTGERTLPGIPEENYWFCRHLFAYELAAGLGAGRILDAGCGEGYGTALLAGVRWGRPRPPGGWGPPTGAGGRPARGPPPPPPPPPPGPAPPPPPPPPPVGMERDPVAVAHAAARYPGARFVRGDCGALPFSDGAFDAVVSLQVVEHLPDPAAFVAECSRVLAPGGTFLCSTPNRLTFTPPGRARNPFHVTELTAAELSALLAPHFGAVRLEGVVDDSPGLADALVEAALAGQPPPPWADDAVAATTTASFSRTDDPDAALDLLAWCTR